MSNIMAAIGLTQFEKMKQFREIRQRLAKHYQKLLIDVEGVKCINRDFSSVNPHIFVIRLLDDTKRDSIREQLKLRGIECGVHYYPNHFLDKYRSQTDPGLVVTEKIWKQVLSLPLHCDLTAQDVEKVVNELRSLL